MRGTFSAMSSMRNFEFSPGAFTAAMLLLLLLLLLLPPRYDGCAQGPSMRGRGVSSGRRSGAWPPLRGRSRPYCDSVPRFARYY